MTPTYPFLAVAFYTGINGLILLTFAFRIVALRRARRIAFGDGGDAELIRLMRGQANFTECVPFALILLFLMALLGTPAWVIHLFGLPLTLARLLHASYFLRAGAPMRHRVLAAGTTFTVLGLASAGLVLHAAAQML